MQFRRILLYQEQVIMYHPLSDADGQRMEEVGHSLLLAGRLKVMLSSLYDTVSLAVSGDRPGMADRTDSQ